MSSSSPPAAPDDDRPTVIPTLDVEGAARWARSSSPAPTPSSIPPDDDRPTLVPSFDVEEMARRSVTDLSPSSIPPEDETPTVMPPFDSPERPGDEPEIEIQEGEGASLDPLDAAHVLADGGDDLAALAVLEGILERTPMDASTRQLAARVDRTLSEKYVEQLGSMESVPRLAISLERLVSLSLDHRAGFLLSLVDGSSSIALLLDLSGMTASEVLGMLVDLKERGIITLRG